MLYHFNGGDTLHTRIKEIRKNLDMTQDAFANELGATRGMIAKYETGLVVPDKPIRLLICQKFNVNETWLETGEGVPYKEGLIPVLVHALSQMPDVQALLEQKLPNVSDATWRKMNEAVREFIESMK